MVLDDLRFRMPHGHDVSDVLILLFQSYALATDHGFLKPELFVEPVNDIGKGRNRMDLIDV